MTQSTAHTSDRYLEPGWFTTHVFNRAVRWLNRRGVSVAGSAELLVRGRRSGEVRATVVNVLTVDGRRYLVAPRGTTQWVRNLRVAGRGALRVGRRATPFVAVELTDDEKPSVLRAYVERWGWEVGSFFEDLPKQPTDGDLAAIAPGFPVFALTDA